jgi:Glycine-zipper domain
MILTWCLLVSIAPTMAAQDLYASYCRDVRKNPSYSGEAVAQAATPAPQTGYQTSQPGYQQPRRHVLRGAGRGAALGAVGGAIAGDPAKGAAAGAAMGGTVGVIRRRQDRRMQQNPPQ